MRFAGTARYYSFPLPVCELIPCELLVVYSRFIILLPVFGRPSVVFERELVTFLSDPCCPEVGLETVSPKIVKLGPMNVAGDFAWNVPWNSSPSKSKDAGSRRGTVTSKPSGHCIGVKSGSWMPWCAATGGKPISNLRKNSLTFANGKNRLPANTWVAKEKERAELSLVVTMLWNELIDVDVCGVGVTRLYCIAYV